MPLLAEKKSGTGYALHFSPSEPAIIHLSLTIAYLALIKVHHLWASDNPITGPISIQEKLGMVIYKPNQIFIKSFMDLSVQVGDCG